MRTARPEEFPGFPPVGYLGRAYPSPMARSDVPCVLYPMEDAEESNVPTTFDQWTQTEQTIGPGYATTSAPALSSSSISPSPLPQQPGQQLRWEETDTTMRHLFKHTYEYEIWLAVG